MARQRTIKVIWKTAAELAREAKGYSLAQAARRLRLGASYVRRFERWGRAPLFTATKMAYVYGCPDTYFERPTWVAVDPSTGRTLGPEELKMIRGGGRPPERGGGKTVAPVSH